MNASAELVTASSQAESGYSTEMLKLDGKSVMGDSVMLLPGQHTVEVAGKCVPRTKGAALFGPVAALEAHAATAVAAERNAQYSDLLKACFIARPTRAYEVRALAEGGVWHVQVVDQTTTYDVKSPCKEVVKVVAGPAGRASQPVDPFDK